MSILIDYLYANNFKKLGDNWIDPGGKKFALWKFNTGMTLFAVIIGYDFIKVAVDDVTDFDIGIDEKCIVEFIDSKVKRFDDTVIWLEDA